MEPSRFKSVRGVIYDLDGTLVDSFADIWIGVNHALATEGLAPLPLEQVRAYVGDGARRLIERCVGDRPAELVDRVYRAFIDYYTTHPAETVRPYDGAAATLAALRARGYRQAVLTNKPETIARPLLERLGLARELDGIWGERADAPVKPNPEAVARVLRHWGEPPNRCVIVGDGPADWAAARAAGTLFIGVGHGQSDPVRLRALGADAVIDRLEELLDLLPGVRPAD